MVNAPLAVDEAQAPQRTQERKEGKTRYTGARGGEAFGGDA